MSEPGKKNAVDLEALRCKLAAQGAQPLWRSLDELAETDDYRQFLDHEFPHDPQKDPGGVSRRDALKLMAASAAMAGLTACTRLPTEKIVPYVQAPEEIVPGKPLYYATATTSAGVAMGLLVESHMGRPTKIEGNPEHPGSLGATDAFAQASVLQFYDPDRSQVVMHNGRAATWSDFMGMWEDLRQSLALSQGEGFRILTETFTSPTLSSQLEAFLAQFPKARWHQYEPAGRENVWEGAQLAFGQYVETIYHFQRADVAVALDSDFLATHPGRVRYARDFAARRRLSGPQDTLNRLYAVEAMPSITGLQADHRLPLRAGEVEGFARALAAQLGVQVGGAPSSASPAVSHWAEVVARDLTQHRGASIVIAGEQQPAAVHAIAHALNEALGNTGKTVVYTDPIEPHPVEQTRSLRELVAAMDAGKVETLLIVESNPVYTAPADLEFEQALLKVKSRMHLGLYADETAVYCQWHVPSTHHLESWGDARAYDGTVSTIQPLIAPLYDGRSVYELLAVMLGEAGRVSHDIVHDYWQGKTKEKDYEVFWQTCLHDGVMPNTAFAAKKVSIASGLASRLAPAAAGAPAGMEIIFRPDPTVGDGRFANNGWQQELPKPVTHLTWDNAAMLSPATAQRLGVSDGDVVELRYLSRKVEGAVWIVPGHADEAVTVHLGYGRERAGRVGTGRGFNAYALRTSDQPWFGTGVEVHKTGKHYPLATTQYHNIISHGIGEIKEEERAQENRDLVRIATLDEFRKNPKFAQNPADETTQAQSLYGGYKYEGYRWAMSIDLNTCIGCNACVVACQSENNIAVVGKEEVIAGREMHWIRVDTYFRGNLDRPQAFHQAVPCMQCENAPCEYVCPVGATVHSPEGLNEMIYNRCVGTRYCSNNCPYKVRRFNFKLYSDWTTPSLYGMRNPDVTVRSRGVMEKCTYCIQRINARKIEAEEQNRQIRDGEILTACQQVCPTQAIVFGNLSDPNSRVTKLKAQPQNYGLLVELNTKPRTTYLAKVTNPNPELKE
jgi:MoCo/4Fe-4S cofactor protein with predicted Tat translocation signal